MYTSICVLPFIFPLKAIERYFVFHRSLTDCYYMLRIFWNASMLNSSNDFLLLILFSSSIISGPLRFWRKFINEKMSHLGGHCKWFSILEGSCTLLGMLFSQNQMSSIKKTQIKAKLFEEKKTRRFFFCMLAKRVESKHYHNLTNQNEFYAITNQSHNNVSLSLTKFWLCSIIQTFNRNNNNKIKCEFKKKAHTSTGSYIKPLSEWMTVYDRKETA